MTRNLLDSAAADFETLKSRRIATLDLERASLDADRDKFEAFLTDRVAEAVVSSHPDRYRALWQSLLIEADRRFAWQPSPLPARPISLEPSNDVTARRAARVLAMVHELHKAGYQRIRILPYLSASGWWRCEITSADNIAGDGYTIEPSGDTDDAVARYSRADGADYFGWPGAAQLSARALAARFLETFPRIAARGQGRDWLYAGWLTDVLGRAEGGRAEDLLYLFADWDLGPEVLRDWQPPPPIRS
jgi:hypothetical protein